MDGKSVILLAEDEPADVFIMRRTLAKTQSPVSLQVVRDGEEAIEYLSGQNVYANRELHPLPNLILLDIKLPRKNGFDVLEWLKYHAASAHIPVVMVTSSSVKSDIDKAYAMGASGYLLKPVALDTLQRLLANTDEFLKIERGVVP